MRQIPSFEETYRITSEKHNLNVEKHKKSIRDAVANRISAASVTGCFHCTVNFINFLDGAQTEAFYEAIDFIGAELEQMGYEVLYTHSGDEANDTYLLEEMRISWYVEM